MILYFSWSFTPFLYLYFDGLIRVGVRVSTFSLFENLIFLEHDSLDIHLVDFFILMLI
jgi:hypothetical protein